MIDKTGNIILELIRKALNSEYAVDISQFHDANWKCILEIATIQGVFGICFDGLEKILRSENLQSFPFEVKMEWIGQVAMLESMNKCHQEIIEELTNFYKNHGLTVMLLKGYGLSKYWPKAEHRPVGDIDIYLKSTESASPNSSLPVWKKGDKLVVEKLGVKMDDGHEHHTCFLYKGVMVENHYDFINVKAHKDAPKIEARLKSLAQSQAQDSSGTYGFEITNADFNAIFLIRHLGQHFAGERITLRQLLDWGLFLKYDGEKVHWNEIVPFLHEMGIWTFFNQINAICVDFLGIVLPNEIPPIERSQDLEERILMDIFEPEFAEEKPKGLFPVLLFKLRRWWCNRWKHPLVYNEWLLPMFLTLLWSKLRRIETIKD